MIMEIISGLILWMGDVLGLKWVIGEKNKWRKVAKAIIYLLAGIILVMVVFAVLY
jgi:hypothetical protein